MTPNPFLALFHVHVGTCDQCRTEPTNLCARGVAILSNCEVMVDILTEADALLQLERPLTLDEQQQAKAAAFLRQLIHAPLPPGP